MAADRVGARGCRRPVFESTTHAEKLIGLVMQHYNATATDLNRGRFAPLFDVDKRHNEVLWELWIDGFERAMRLRPQSWVKIADGDEEARTALAGLITLAEISRDDSSLAEAEIHDLTEEAPDLIPRWVERLNASRISQHLAGQSGMPTPFLRQSGPQRPMPMRLRQEIQEVLRPQLKPSAALTGRLPIDGEGRVRCNPPSTSRTTPPAPQRNLVGAS